LQEVVRQEPAAEDLWSLYQVLAQLYVKIGQPPLALEAARQAISLAPEDQQAALQTLIDQIQSLAPEGSEP